MAIFSADGKVAADINNTTTTAKFQVGTQTFDNAGKRLVYVQANNAIAAATVVRVGPSFAATANSGSGQFTTMVAMPSGSYGFVYKTDTKL